MSSWIIVRAKPCYVAIENILRQSVGVSCHLPLVESGSRYSLSGSFFERGVWCVMCVCLSSVTQTGLELKVVLLPQPPRCSNLW